jgi:hypothetical protein
MNPITVIYQYLKDADLLGRWFTDCNQALNKKHPPPTRKSAFSIQMIQSKVQKSSKTYNCHLSRLQESKTKLLFFASVPLKDDELSPQIQTNFQIQKDSSFLPY